VVRAQSALAPLGLCAQSALAPLGLCAQSALGCRPVSVGSLQGFNCSIGIDLVTAPPRDVKTALFVRA
jgi:hypothetical protein